MNYILLSVVILGLVHRAHGRTCYDCSRGGYNMGPSPPGECYSTIATGTGATAKETCDPDTTGVVHYCRTKFTIQDGVTTAVVRGCAASTVDEDINTASVPGSDKCVTALNNPANPTDTTECYFHCNTDNCNTKADTSLIPCSTDCNTGSCNYLTGTCVCYGMFGGDECTTTITFPPAPTINAAMSCVQCNSLTDTGCSTSKTPSACPAYERYCSTATTSIYDSSFDVVRTVYTRGCTSEFRAVDECAFTDIFGDRPINDVGYNEFTCYSTCDTDGCNTNIADGIVNGNEIVPLQCVQCSYYSGDSDESCKTEKDRSVCASGSTHCKATVEYLISNRADLSHSEATPAYRLVSLVRECATAAVTSECTSTSVGSLSFERVTCTESCQTDGCNTGWPARPTCITCSTADVGNDYGDGYDECAENPPDADACDHPYQAYCILQESGIDKSNGQTVKGYPHRVVRRCAHFDIGTGCSSTTVRSTEIESCNRTCTTDGCNVGSGGIMPLQNMAALIAPIIVGWLAQYL